MVAAGIAYSHYYPTYIKPCSKPLGYYVADFDPRFKISEQEFLAAVAEAEAIWEESSGQDLFVHDEESGALKINLVYDYRQETSDHLQSLGYKIEKTQSSYDNLKAYHDRIYADYVAKKSTLETMVSQFETRKAEYERQVNYWNQQGGAPKKEADKLNSEREALSRLASQIKQLQNTVNSLVGEINNLVPVLNNLAYELHLNVNNYNKVGEERGSQFEEGVYRKDSSEESITVYEFTSREELVRLMAHELGHALGLEHVENEASIMYRLNKNQGHELTEADLSELNRICAL